MAAQETSILLSREDLQRINDHLVVARIRLRDNILAVKNKELGNFTEETIKEALAEGERSIDKLNETLFKVQKAKMRVQNVSTNPAETN